MKLLSLFSGIGAYETALKNLGIEFELVGYCERDVLTGKCYSVLHDVDESLNLKDVSTIDPLSLQDFEILTFSPPCQDISTIGGHAGVVLGARTSLMWKVADIIAVKKPSLLVMENAKTLTGKYKQSLAKYIHKLNELGYNCEVDVLRADQHGLPQMRERTFLIARLESSGLRPVMPSPRPLKKFLKDFIDPGYPIVSIDKEIAYTIRLGGRKSGVDNRHNWDGYMVNGKEYFLSAKDCLRLMGFSSEDYLKLKTAGVSETKICRAAGNSVAVSVLEDIFKANLIDRKNESPEGLFI
jgi:site-specific DNA-cytosine methylase